MKRYLTALLIGCLLSMMCHTQPPYPVGGTDTPSIREHYLYLCDSSNNLTPQQALAKFASGHGQYWITGRTFNVGIKPWIYWFTFSAMNISRKDQATVFRISSSLSYYRIFKLDSAGAPKPVFEGSTATPYNKRPFKHRDIAIPIDLRPGESASLLFSVDKRNRGLYMPLYYETVEQTLRRDGQWHWVYAWHFGIYLFIILFNIFLFSSFRDWIHLWYVGYILSAMLFMFEDEKFYVEYFPTAWTGFCDAAGTFPFSLLLLGCGIKVMQLLLGQERRNSVFYVPVVVVSRLGFGVAGLLFVGAIVNAPGMNGLITFLHLVVDVIVGISLLLILASTVEKIVQRQSLAVYYLIATLTPFAGAIIYYLNHFAIVNINPIQPNGIVAGITVEIILMSFLLVIRYNNLRREKLDLLHRIHEQDRALVIKVLDAQEEERKRIASDLHDDLGGTLNALKLHISRKQSDLAELGEADKEYYLQSIKLASRASEDLRSVAHNLLPKDFTRIGLVRTLENTIALLGKSTPIRFTFITQGDTESVGDLKAIIIYRIINEIVNNIVKHAEASEATVQLLNFNGELQIIAEDNGIGMDHAEQGGGGMGLNNIRSRVAFLRGELQIESNNKGTSIIITLPINKPGDEQ